MWKIVSVPPGQIAGMSYHAMEDISLPFKRILISPSSVSLPVRLDTILDYSENPISIYIMRLLCLHNHDLGLDGIISA